MSLNSDSKSKPLLPLNGADSTSYGSTSASYQIDYVSAPADKVLALTPPEGLTSAEATQRLAQYGPNALPDNEESKILKFLKGFIGPMPIMIWIAILIEAIEQNWLDFVVLFVLQVLNGTVGFIEDVKAGDAVSALKDSLKPEAHVKRDGVWKVISGENLVPGDRVTLHSGSNIPADCYVDDEDAAEEPTTIDVDQAGLTGESLPVEKRKTDKVLMGSTVVKGECEGVVYATGVHTMVGKTASMIASVHDMGHFQKVLLQITFFLMFVSFVLVAICLGYLLYHGTSILEAIAFCVVLLVASIPIAMQVVCTTTMALGSRQLSEHKAIVTRLSCIEELASMNMLCSDKTGTLTQNKMMFFDELPIFEKGITRDDMYTFACLAAKWKEEPKDALDTMVLKNPALDQVSGKKSGSSTLRQSLEKYTQLKYVPFDPTIKRTESEVQGPDGKRFKVTKGAPQIVLQLAHNYSDIKDEVDAKVLELAHRGIRSLAVARTDPDRFHGESKWVYMGILTFTDPPRVDTAATIEAARENGVGVKMITGDQQAIAIETCKQIGLGPNILGADQLPSVGKGDRVEISSTLGAQYGDHIMSADGFAQVFPEHKFLIIEILRQRGWVVGMTGDGVNDAPALKKADVGIAVSGATDAAKAAADIVLTAEGLSVIIDGIVISRKIFQRMKNYVTYRVACTIQLLMFFFISVLTIHPNTFDDGNGDFSAFSGHPIFKLPVIALVLIVILNDGTIITIAYDNVDASKLPEQWRLVELFTVASMLGFVAVGSSIMMLYFGLNSHKEGSTFQKLGLQPLSYGEVMMLMYLKISLSDFLTVFSARTRWFFFERAPAWPLLIAACSATIASTFIAVYWPESGDAGLRAISWKLVSYTWIYSLVWFFVQDIAKVCMFAAIRKLHEHSSEHKKKAILLKQAKTRVHIHEDFYASKGHAAFYESTSSSMVPMGMEASGSGKQGDGMSLDQALQRIKKMEKELYLLRSVVQAHTGKTD